MLELHSNNRELTNLVSGVYRSYNINLYGDGNMYVRTMYLSDVLLPLVVNDIDLDQATYKINDTDMLLHCENFITSRLNQLSETKLDIVRLIHGPVIESQRLRDIVLEAGYEPVPEIVEQLYNKTIHDVIARNEFTPREDYYVDAFVSKEKHSILLMMNGEDPVQASDMFLTYGLIPVLYKDIAEKFNAEETTYFKALVSRSQVKRISNVNVKTAFEEMEGTEKYLTCMVNLQRTRAVKDMVRNRTMIAERDLISEEQSAQRSLREYEQHLKRWREASKIVEQLKTDEDGVIKSFEDALSMKELVRLETYNNEILRITFKDTVRFFDPEEAELALRNKDQYSPITKVLADIFINQRYKLWVSATFQFSLNPEINAEVSVQGEGTMKYKQIESMYNPHIFFFACLGDYKKDLIKARSESDIMMFNAIALASTRSINFKDGAVINRWYDTLSSYYNDNYDTYILNSKCLEDVETGERLSFNDYFQLLEEDL